MNTRTDYEHQEKDTDGFYYWFTNKEVEYAYYNPELKDFVEWWDKNVDYDDGLFYKGTALYFTFKGKKYYVSWTWYHPTEIKKACMVLHDLGATNLQLNYGELD